METVQWKKKEDCGVAGDPRGSSSDQMTKPSIPNVPQEQQQTLQHQSSSFKRLIGACKRKDLETIRSILAEQPELINRRDRYNRNLLHYTVILYVKQRLDDLAPQSGGQMDSIDLDSSTCSDNSDEQQRLISERNLACFNYLLDRCHQKLWWQQDLDGLSLLHLAVISSNNSLVRYIVYEHPYSVDYPLVSRPDNERHSPLHWAVITNNLECVKLLINSSAGLELIHEPDLNGATPLHYATQTHDYPRYRRQLRQMLQNVATSGGRPSADKDRSQDRGDGSQEEPHCSGAAIFQSPNRKRRHHHSLEVLETLLKIPQVNIECRDKDRRTPLLWAASSGNRDAALLLIGAGANPNSCDVNKLGALHCAASHGFSECLESLLSADQRAGGSTTGERSVNQPDNLNCTPIFYAVLSGNIDCVELLADRGADLNWQDSKGRSGAHFAALKGQLNSLKLLRRRGANLWLANRQGDLPLHYAIKAGRHQVAKWLLDHSPYENSVNAINNFGRAPIHLAVQRDDSELLEYLIKRDANLNQLVKIKDRNHQHHHNQTGRKNKPVYPDSHVIGTSQRAATVAPDPMRAKNGNSECHYETVLDIAKRLGHGSCLRLLVENGAKAAAQVMNGRIGMAARGSEPGACSLFDLKSVEGPSPIGFETSSSSAASPQQTSRQQNKGGSSESCLPKLSRPKPDCLPQSDSSAESSALSQNSLTSIRGFPMRQPEVAPSMGHQSYAAADLSTPYDAKPFKGGISYNNERINASIKCRLYDGQSSFPPFFARDSRPEDVQNQQAVKQTAQSRHRSAPTSAQEIITNVNVYTSPCPLAHLEKHQDLNKQQPNDVKIRSSDNYCSKYGSAMEDTSDGPATETSCDEHNNDQQHWDAHLPRSQVYPRPTNRIAMMGSHQQLQQLSSRLPPSQGHEQHLPVILSDREDMSTSGETSKDRSPEVAAGLEPRYIPHYTSPSREEPRFDRSSRGQSRRMQRTRQQVRSPVGEYIKGGPLTATHPNQIVSKPTNQNHSPYESHHLPDFSQVKPKVDSHRTSCEGDRSRSLSRQTPRNKQQESRSLSRHTFTREHRQVSQDSFELELGIEKSIWKYRQEKRLFEELQGLKRSQIRSGRANEAVLVKRLVEHLHREQLAGSNDLLGVENYTGPYTYKSYERFLYDQLRKLSQSNCAKLSSQMRDFEQEQLRSEFEDMHVEADDHHHHDDIDSDAEQQRKFLEEDLQADLELRRVIEGDRESKNPEEDPLEHQVESGLETDREVIEQQVDQTSAGEQPKKEPDDQRDECVTEPEVRRDSLVSVGSSSRRSSLDLVEEKSKSLLPRSANDTELGNQQTLSDDTKSLIEDEANSICSAIMVDALGNLTSRSPVSDASTQQGVSQANDEFNDEDLPATNGEQKGTPSGRAQSRRRSVVNIGNKLEVIYHDVGIEIDHAEDLPATEELADDDGQTNGQEAEDARVERSIGDHTGEPPTMKELEEEEECKIADQAQSLEQPADRRGLGDIESELFQVDVTNSRARTANRRASSPLASIERPKSPASPRRISSIDSGPKDDLEVSRVSEIKKVFNGYDLDELHRRKVQQVPPEQADSASSKKTHRKLAASRELRVKKERSRLPSKRFRPRVDLDGIKERWSRVKAIERKRLVDGNQTSLEPVGCSHFAKSQPNLRPANDDNDHDRSDARWAEQAAASSEGQNYLLLYEINALSKRQVAPERLAWCRGKAVKIVDVRSLKRTLSLPESVMYSNDLLKKFNILKL